MPRPGPRPYECVRRAWHSDRHQPMRGSLIQEIFRIADEIHSPATKKNKEWQVKLPVVVLRSEEIMYSKANSEVEYMDLKTLRDRTSDAINTIIRRDESTETGDLLPPCIEAALNLGCTPRRTPRSQRNVNPRCYLNTSSSQEPTNFENFISGTQAINSPRVAHHSIFIKPRMSINSTQKPIFQSNNECCTNKIPFASESVAVSRNKQSLMENYPTSKCSVYPLYYGACFRFDEPGPPEINFIEKTTVCLSSSMEIAQTHDGKNPCDMVCDLSLRLAPLSVPCQSLQHNQMQRAKDVGSSSLEVNKSMPQFDKQIVFCSRSNNNVPSSGIQSIEWRIKGGLDGGKVRKRKAVSTNTWEDRHFISWTSKSQHSQLTESMENSGS